MSTWFVTEGDCKYICKDMGWMWIENGSDSEITKCSKIKINKGRETWFVTWASNTYLFWALVLSVTNYPVLVHILADLEILYTGLGRVAVTAATINEFYNWAMFVLLIPFATHSEKPCVSDVDYDLCHFLLLCVAPFTYPVDREITDKNEWDNYKLSYVFIGIMFCAHITEMLGTHSIVGALVFGLILPREKFVDMLMERSDDLVSTYLEPLLFIGCGVRFDFTTFKKRKLRDAMIITLLSCCTKIVSTVIATGFYRMPFRDGVALGELLNTKGLLPLVMLNILQVTDWY